MITFLFNSSGNFVAFRSAQDGRFLFDKTGHWIGWFPWGDAEAVDRRGKYLGTVVGDRLLQQASHPYRGYPGYPGYPGYAGYPGYPGHAGYAPKPSGFRDVEPARLVHS